MKISELWGSVRDQTERLSSVCRQLALGAAAIAWFFKSPEVTFPAPVLTSLLFIIAYFSAEVLQYLTAIIGMQNWLFDREHELRYEEYVESMDIGLPPKRLTRIPYRFFFLKVVFLCCSFIALGVELVARMV